MPTVNTVLGPVDVNDLGFTLMHEHVLNSSAGYRRLFLSWWTVTRQSPGAWPP